MISYTNYQLWWHHLNSYTNHQRAILWLRLFVIQKYVYKKRSDGTTWYHAPITRSDGTKRSHTPIIRSEGITWSAYTGYVGTKCMMALHLVQSHANPRSWQSCDHAIGKLFSPRLVAYKASNCYHAKNSGVLSHSLRYSPIYWTIATIYIYATDSW